MSTGQNSVLVYQPESKNAKTPQKFYFPPYNPPEYYKREGYENKIKQRSFNQQIPALIHKKKFQSIMIQ